ncbi:MAG TPA: hypothetical protein VK842_10635, partial [bacterium]|nr:hypothetical protein [bacterium]
QELLQEALKQAKQHETTPKAQAAPAQAAAANPSDQLQTLKVADIYIKKGAFDEAAEVLQEVLASDPSNALAQQKLKEVNQRRGQKPEAGGKGADDGAAAQKAEEEARQKAEAKRKADEEAKQKADAEAKRKAEEEAKQKADAEAKRKAEEEAKLRAEEEAKQKADAESKRKAEEEAKQKADAEAKQKAEAAEARQRAEAEAEAARLAEEAEAKQREAEELAQRKAAEEAQRVSEAEAKERQANKLSSDDILSVMAGGHEELISDEPAAKPKEAPKPAAGGGLSDAVKASLADFIRAQAIEASLLLAPDGKVLDAQGSGDHASLAVSATAVFHNTEKAAQAMHFGGLKQIMIVGEDTRQILFVSLKAGVLVALTGRNTNLGLLRVAVNDLVKRV